MLSNYAKREWLTIIAIGVMLSVTLLIIGLWWLAILVVMATLAVLTFFRDPDRTIPSHRNIMVSPADGKVSSIHNVEYFEPFGEGAVCIRIFLSVLNVHINRSPCHGQVQSVSYKSGQHLNALNPESAEVNEAALMVLVHPFKQTPIAAVRQVAGLLARTIVCAVEEGDILQRGQRYGIIKLGSTTELYIPTSMEPQVIVKEGDMVHGAISILANVAAPVKDDKAPSDDSPATQQTLADEEADVDESGDNARPDITTDTEEPNSDETQVSAGLFSVPRDPKSAE